MDLGVYLRQRREVSEVSDVEGVNGGVADVTAKKEHLWVGGDGVCVLYGQGKRSKPAIGLD